MLTTANIFEDLMNLKYKQDYVNGIRWFNTDKKQNRVFYNNDRRLEKNQTVHSIAFKKISYPIIENIIFYVCEKYQERYYIWESRAKSSNEMRTCYNSDYMYSPLHCIALPSFSRSRSYLLQIYYLSLCLIVCSRYLYIQ